MSKLRNIFSRLAATITLLSLAPMANAIPAIPEPITITQPDGSVITIRMYGDEFGVRMMTTDNLPIMKNQEGIYEYANPWDTSKCSGIKVSDINERDAKELDWIASSGIKTASAQVLTHGAVGLHKTPSAPAKIRISNFPTIGRQKALVVLVEFADKQFSAMEDAYSYYHGMLNEEGFTYTNGANGSARDFYLDSSNGLFDPEFVVVGPVKLPGTVAYYGADTATELDPNAWEMVVEACKAIDEEVDFSEFDADHDGCVDSIYFFYAGFGEADSASGDAIWPHSGLLKDNWGVDLELDGTIINNYACSNEIRFNSAPIWKPVGIGTFVHEFGHVLGLADHYDTLYSSGRSGVDQWDTMAAASYNNNQNTPPSFSAFERAELGWLNYTEINPLQEGILKVPVLGSENSEALVVRVPDEDVDEYFVIERRNKIGWDSTLPAEGLLVWHIDMVEELWRNNHINNDPVHQHVDLVEADGTENATSFHGDVFPGSGKVSKFDFVAWNGETLFSFDHVVHLPEETLVILGGTEFTPAVPNITISDVHGTSFSVAWEAAVDALEYSMSVFDSEGNALEDFSHLTFDEARSIDICGLNPMSDYAVEMTASAGSYVSEMSRITVTTGMLEFFESAPQNLAVSYIGDGRFEASWEALEGAADYEATLYQMEYGEPLEYSYGFENGVEGMPEGWTTNSTKMSKPVFGEKSPALKFESDGDFLEINYPGCLISSLEFYQFSQIESNNIQVEAFNADGEMIMEQTLPASSKGNVETLEFPSSTEKVVLTFSRSGGYMILDDIAVAVSRLEGRPCNPYIEVSTSGFTTIEIEGLDEDKEYGIMVTGLNANEKSRPSEMFCFVPSTITNNITPATTETEVNEEWMDLSGRKVSATQAPKGIYIIRKGNTSEKIVKM